MRIAVVLFLMASATTAGHAQRLPVGDAMEDYTRLLQTIGKHAAGSFMVRPLESSRMIGEGDHPWSEITTAYRRADEGHLEYALYDAYSTFYVNSNRPWGQNDGPVWQGAGATSRVIAGGFARYRFFSASLRPTFTYSENASFRLSAIGSHERLPRFAYPYRNHIDLPQRFGPEPITRLHLGDSYAQIAYAELALGVSTENLWWGPGIRNAIIMSNNAAGFRHVYFRTLQPLDIRIGSLEGAWIWGSLAHSKYFVDASYSPDRQARPSEENRRFLTAIALTYAPRWIDGLYLGAAQYYMLHAAISNDFVGNFAVINLPFVDDSNRHGRGTDDKGVSIFGRWVLPESGFEAYGEWARGDHTSTFRDLFVAPDHARGFTLGFQKTYAITPRYLTRITAEHTFLEAPREEGSRDTIAGGGGYFYVHQSIRQGYTHRGQVLGAGIGPGSQGQFFRFDLFAPFGRVGVHALREVFDNDLYYNLKDTHFEHQVDVAAGLSALVFYQRFQMEGGFTRIKTFNRDFIHRNDTYNTNLHLSLRYMLGYR